MGLEGERGDAILDGTRRGEALDDPLVGAVLLALRNGERAELRLVRFSCLRTHERQVGDGGRARREGLRAGGRCR